MLSNFKVSFNLKGSRRYNEKSEVFTSLFVMHMLTNYVNNAIIITVFI